MPTQTEKDANNRIYIIIFALFTSLFMLHNWSFSSEIKAAIAVQNNSNLQVIRTLDNDFYVFSSTPFGKVSAQLCQLSREYPVVPDDHPNKNAWYHQLNCKSIAVETTSPYKT